MTSELDKGTTFIVTLPFKLDLERNKGNLPPRQITNNKQHIKLSIKENISENKKENS